VGLKSRKTLTMTACVFLGNHSASSTNKTMSPLQFNEENHVYTVDGVKIPSVTTVLSSTGISDYSRVPSQTLEEAAARGTAVHRILELYDMGQLAECPEWATEYLDAWKKFKTEMDVKILACEMRVFHDKFWFAGNAGQNREDWRGKVHSRYQNNQRGHAGAFNTDVRLFFGVQETIKGTGHKPRLCVRLGGW
jgi:hypothetical protein